ncbi:hypothetical protein GOP47_0026551 [Adiantum capillus-veneris]|nr:hypothetical protein GOP47_0026551 [Adiantum capillus-veneris]
MRQDLLSMWKNTESIESSLQEQEFQFEDLNLDNMDGSFPSFGALLSNGNVKRVKAMPKQRESLLSDMPLKLGYETVDSVSSSCQANNHEAPRKSTRERKISAKLQESLATKLGKETSKKIKKKTKDEKCIAGDTSNVYVPKFDEVSSLNVEDEETILLKYFDLQTIDDMYLVLKASYYKIRREESSFLEQKRGLSLEEMRVNLVRWLVDSGRVIIERQLDHELTFDEVKVVFM